METQSLIPSFEDKKLHSADKTAYKLFEQLSSEIKAVKNLANPDLCDAKYLPFLAYAFGVEFWDENLSEDKKRALIKKSLALHRHKGTIWALQQVFEALKIEAEVKEWFDYVGEPYHFKVNLGPYDPNDVFDENRLNGIKKRVEIFKNVRSIFDGVNFTLKFKENVNSYGAVKSKIKLDKKTEVKETIGVSNNIQGAMIWQV